MDAFQRLVQLTLGAAEGQPTWRRRTPVAAAGVGVGDREFRERGTSRITRFRRAGGTLVFASHEPELVEALADRSVLLRNGLLHGAGGPQAPSAGDGP